MISQLSEMLADGCGSRQEKFMGRNTKKGWTKPVFFSYKNSLLIECFILKSQKMLPVLKGGDADLIDTLVKIVVMGGQISAALTTKKK